MASRDRNPLDQSGQGREARAVADARRAAIRKSRADDGLIRENFVLPRDEARAKARQWLDTWPKAAYWSRVEQWRALPNNAIEFTMVRLPTAD